MLIQSSLCEQITGIRNKVFLHLWKLHSRLLNITQCKQYFDQWERGITFTSEKTKMQFRPPIPLEGKILELPSSFSPRALFNSSRVIVSCTNYNDI